MKRLSDQSKYKFKKILKLPKFYSSYRLKFLLEMEYHLFCKKVFYLRVQTKLSRNYLNKKDFIPYFLYSFVVNIFQLKFISILKFIMIRKEDVKSDRIKIHKFYLKLFYFYFGCKRKQCMGP